MTKQNPILRLCLIFAMVVALLWLLQPTVLHAEDGGTNFAQVDDTYVFPNCRFGVSNNPATQENYDITGLNIGAYMNWSSATTPYSFGGAEYMQMIQVSESGYTPSGATLVERVTANLGAIWLIGNEPDRYYPDRTSDLLPEQYAQVYHDAYTAIKAIDPTARVSAGGIVQPSVARLAYLNYVLEAYFNQYGMAMPVDVWNIHNYNYDEVSTSSGAGIPPGVDPELATSARWEDTDDIDVFKSHIIAFRTWMKTNGYQSTPLIVTEFGAPVPYYNVDPLYTEELEDGTIDYFDEERAGEVMIADFDYLTTANDPTIGYPEDGGQLVQQWLWFHLDSTGGTIIWGGLLFDPETDQIMQLGQDWKDYVGQIVLVQDLIAVRLQQAAPVIYTGTPVSVTLKARISNAGNIPVQEQVTVRFTDGDSQIIGSPQIVDLDLGGCGRYTEVTATWTGLTPGAYPVTVTVDTTDMVTETDETNNSVSATVIVATNQIFLPMALRVQAYQ